MAKKKEAAQQTQPTQEMEKPRMRLFVQPEELKKNNFALVPAGVYTATVSKVTPRVSKNSGNLLLGIEYTVTSEGPDDSVKTQGRKVFDNLTFTEECLQMIFKRYLAITGEELPEGDYTDEELRDVVANGILNRECVIKVVHKPDFRDENQLRAEVGNVMSIDGE